MIFVIFQHCFPYYKTNICSSADLLLQYKKSRLWLCDTASLWLLCYHFVLGEAEKILVQWASWHCLDYLHERSWNEFKNICALPDSADLVLRSLCELLFHGLFWLMYVFGLWESSMNSDLQAKVFYLHFLMKMAFKS